MTGSRLTLIAGSFVVPLALMVLLFALLGVTLGDLVRTMAATPAWLLAATLAITFANQAISVARWRAASHWLNPKAARPEWGAALEATTWGSFLGQFLPLQLSMTLARWARSRNRTTVGATLYEQSFDLVILLSGAGAATLLLVLGCGAETALAALSAAVVAGCLGVRWLLSAGARMTTALGSSGLPGSMVLGRLAEPLRQASRAPAGLLAFMAGLSALRLVILALRVVLIASVFIGAVHWTTVAIGYPIVGLALGVPFVPAGLGIADWSLTGILVLAGAAAPAAAMTAAASRAINLLTLGVVLIALLPFRARGAAEPAIDQPMSLPG